MPSNSAYRLRMNARLRSARMSLPGWLLALAALVAGHALILARAANIAAPLYGSDEIAYWHNARSLFAGVDRTAFNPYLQQVNCDLFYLIVGWLAQRPEGALTMRLLNYMLLILAASLLYRAARGITSRAWSAVAAAFFFVTGPSVLLIATMPETTYCFFFALLTFVLVRYWAPGAAGASLLVGILTGALMLIKPHGIAVALACMATVLAIPILLRRDVRALRTATIDLVIVAIGFVAAVVAIGSFARGELILSPAKLIGQFYGGILSRSDPLSPSRLLNIAFYYAAHALILVMFFAPAVVLSARLLAKSVIGARVIGARQQQMIVLVTFTAFSAAAIFMMTAVFTETVGAASDLERWRIHGRYWTFLIPWLALIAFTSFSWSEWPGETARADWAVGLLGAAATLLFVLVIAPRFSLHPWDFPELFGFYRPELQNWKMQLLWFPHAFAISLTVILLSFAAWLYRISYRGLIYAAALLIVFVVGNVSTTQWQVEGAASNSGRTASGIAARRIVGEHSVGALIGATYWGQSLYYLAFNLPLHSYVIEKPAGASLSEADLPAGVEWVITAASYQIHFDYRHVIPLPAATLYLVRDAAPKR
jgi:hypothetical protein